MDHSENLGLAGEHGMITNFLRIIIVIAHFTVNQSSINLLFSAISNLILTFGILGHLLEFQCTAAVYNKTNKVNCQTG
jgi:hypothetical protein